MHPTYSTESDSGSNNLALTSNQLARRWWECHPLKSRTDLTPQKEELWRKDVLRCLSAAHTIKNLAEMSFEVVESLYSVSGSAIHHSKPSDSFTDVQPFRLKDFAFELRLEDFAFRWEANSVGPRISAEVISRQIIMPLISTAHLAFSSPNSLGEMSESDLETVSEVKPLTRALLIRYGLHP